MRLPLLAKAAVAVTMMAMSLAATVLATSAGARADEFAGELRCSVSGGFGLAVWGKRAASCVYYRADGQVEFYIGSLNRIGFDLGPTQARQAIFKVLARQPEPLGALDGDFVGAGAGATLGRGFAGEGLIGGRGNAAVIVPAANSRLTGLNFEGGLGVMHLRYAGAERRRTRYRNTNPDDVD